MGHINAKKNENKQPKAKAKLSNRDKKKDPLP